MMSKVSAILFACVTLTSLTIDSVDAHGRMSKPYVTFSGPYPDSPVDQIDGYKALPPPSGQSYSGTPETNTKAFTASFASSAYPTLRAFVMANQGKDVRACGASTVEGVSRQVLPEKIEFSFRAGEGFVPDHQGPCEVWCGNNTRVFHDDNCAKTFREGPALLPYDKRACDASGSDVLTFYWLALHLPKWQLYVNCAAVQTSGRAAVPSSGSGNGNSTAAATKAPGASAAADSDARVPAATTAAPTSRPVTPTTAPVATKTTPVATAAPSTTAAPKTDKCRVRGATN